MSSMKHRDQLDIYSLFEKVLYLECKPHWIIIILTTVFSVNSQLWCAIGWKLYKFFVYQRRTWPLHATDGVLSAMHDILYYMHIYFCTVCECVCVSGVNRCIMLW